MGHFCKKRKVKTLSIFFLIFEPVPIKSYVNIIKQLLCITDPDRVHHPVRHNKVQALVQRVCDHSVADGLPHWGHALLLDGRIHLQEESSHGCQIQSGSSTKHNRYITEKSGQKNAMFTIAVCFKSENKKCASVFSSVCFLQNDVILRIP